MKPRGLLLLGPGPDLGPPLALTLALAELVDGGKMADATAADEPGPARLLLAVSAGSTLKFVALALLEMAADVELFGRRWSTGLGRTSSGAGADAGGTEE